MTNPRSEALWRRIRGGVVPAMATPIRTGGEEVDLDRVPSLVDFLVSREVAGLFVGGTTGEGILLSLPERMKLHEASVRAARGRVPVLAHVGDNTTANAVRLARHAHDIGADAVVAVTPTFYPVPDPSLVKHYAAIGEATPLPLFAYDIPQMAANGISPAALREMCKSVPNFAGIKSSRSDAHALVQFVACLTPSAGLLAGFEPTALGSLTLGAQGLVSGLATAVPEPVVALVRAVARAEVEEARRQQSIINAILDLVPANARIGCLKAILQARGVAVGEPVPPRPHGNPALWPKIQPLLRGAGPSEVPIKAAHA